MEKIAFRNKTVASLHFFYNACYVFLKLLVQKKKHLTLAKLAVKLPTKHGSFRGPNINREINSLNSLIAGDILKLLFF